MPLSKTYAVGGAKKKTALNKATHNTAKSKSSYTTTGDAKMQLKRKMDLASDRLSDDSDPGSYTEAESFLLPRKRLRTQDTKESDAIGTLLYYLNTIPTVDQLEELTMFEVYDGKYPGGDRDSLQVRFQNLIRKKYAKELAGTISTEEEIEFDDLESRYKREELEKMADITDATSNEGDSQLPNDFDLGVAFDRKGGSMLFNVDASTPAPTDDRASQDKAETVPPKRTCGNAVALRAIRHVANDAFEAILRLATQPDSDVKGGNGNEIIADGGTYINEL